MPMALVLLLARLQVSDTDPETHGFDGPTVQVFAGPTQELVSTQGFWACWI
jgi:hypothetical protein